MPGRKFLAIATPKVGYRANGAFRPKKAVGKARDFAHVDSAAYHTPAFAYNFAGLNDKFAHWSKNDGGVERHWLESVRIAGPHRPKRKCELLSLLITWPSECVDPATP
jgi:hypothetical protein